MKLPGGYNYILSVASDRRKQLSFGVKHSQYFGFENSSNSKNFGVSVQYLPSDALRIFVRPSLSLYNNELQYLSTTQNNIGENSYIFASIDQITTSITMRLDYVVSPDFTIQYYGSPFISAVDYSDAKTIINPQADNFNDRFIKPRLLK